MIEDEATRRLSTALNHLHAFAATFNPKNLVDEDCNLSATDLNPILYA
ncbi:hypothetical protein [uncultured Sphingomonas sp.]|nr:hypothetical protein [uncultured Sphingomonas sp.]